MIRTKKAIAAAALAATLAGGAVGMLTASPGFAGAAEVTQTATGAVSWMSKALSGLVTDGTITQNQADAVEQALDAARPAHGGGDAMGHRSGPGGPGAAPAEIAQALGLTEDALRTELAAGKTLAQVATEKGIDVQTLKDAIVDGMRQHLAEEVAAGEHTQAEADQKLADAAARADAIVNGQMQGPGGPRGGHADRMGTAEPGAARPDRPLGHGAPGQAPTAAPTATPGA